MKNVNSLMMVAVMAVFMLSGCSGLNKMKKNASNIQFEITPEVLEMHGGSVDLSMNARFPEKFFNKKAVVVATPVLKSEAGELEYQPVTLQGEKVTENNKVINYASGGRLTYQGSVDYSDDVRVSELFIKMEASKGKKTVLFDPIKVADGVVATPLLLQPGEAQTIVAPDKFQRIIPETYEADIHYDINSARVKKEETASADVDKLIDKVVSADKADNIKFRDIKISAYASPDGELDYNDKLAGNRSETANKFLRKELKDLNVSSADQDALFQLMSTAEDWDGFKELVGKSTIQDKDLILRVLSMYNDPEVREKEIRNISAAFTELADEILPLLRRSKMMVNVDVIGKSDEELLSLAQSRPGELTVEEILYAATLTTDVQKQNGIYKSATDVYPQCFRAWNDLGMTYLQMGDLNNGKRAIDKAAALNANNAIVMNNQGVIALAEGDFDKAEGLFRSAAGAGNEVDHNMGIIHVKKGNYSQAVSGFGSACLFNAALAQTLNKDYSKAMKTLDCIEDPCAMTDYLKAVIYARQGQSSQAFASLGKAIQAKPELKQVAKTDLEFGKFFEDATFKGLVN